MKKRILIAPLNWGLGHATRSIPIINALLAHHFEPIVASDGMALDLLRKEFPDLQSVELPSYSISYPKKGQHFKLKLLQNSPKLMKAVKAEKKATAAIIEKFSIDGIISDNRLGVHSKQVPCVFVTHQIQVLSGNTTWLSTKLHQKIIKRFHECWIPDNLGDANLSGQLGHSPFYEIPLKFIGPLSRLEPQDLPLKYDIMVMLSGPEPQRSLLETHLLKLFKSYDGKVLFVRGVVESEEQMSTNGHMTVYNFMTSTSLERAINESDIIVARSGYTTIMDLAKLNKKAFLIPTPGQFEQEYLAARLTKLGYVPSCAQQDFTLEHLEQVSNYQGLNTTNYSLNYKKLFGLFEGK